MSENVVSMLERRPHVTGKARCMDCRHEWVGVASIDDALESLECPRCELWKGRFLGEFVPDGDRWVCRCGNDLFYVDPNGAICANCATRQVIS